MNKLKLIIIAFILVLVAAFMLRFVLGPEDAWLCEDGKWVRHGQPSGPIPSEVCGEKKQGDEGVVLPECSSFAADECPLDCAVCPSCPDCADASCKSARLCAELAPVEMPAETPIETTTEIISFADCVAAGNPVMESFPRQCRAGEDTFFEDAHGEEAKKDLIRLTFPKDGGKVKSPLRITGEARGNWFFEASFPVSLTNWDGLIIAEGIATAQGDWMTEDFVPFTAELAYTVDTTVSNRGALILKKDNPSGLPENDDALEITVFFE